ncbi:hypothetical protein BV20DRAFT_376914 [Pilatotrama ljubarskyi]|nr:hypothetical protein BV20DRAFT_376914 [Pilatotrama ljubarskyi]
MTTLPFPRHPLERTRRRFMQTCVTLCPAPRWSSRSSERSLCLHCLRPTTRSSRHAQASFPQLA